MKQQLTVSVLGCGWLGLPLAEALILNGCKVKGTTTSPEKLQTLRDRGIEPYLVHFEENFGSQAEDLLDCDVIVIAIPPGSRSPQGADNYRRMARYFTREIPKSGIRKVIL